jgi:hypothetical protein
LTGALVGDHVGQRRNRQAQQAQAAPPPASTSGHWETRTVTTSSGETYEERVWVQNR